MPAIHLWCECYEQNVFILTVLTTEECHITSINDMVYAANDDVKSCKKKQLFAVKAMLKVCL